MLKPLWNSEGPTTRNTWPKATLVGIKPDPALASNWSQRALALGDAQANLLLT